MSAKIFSPLKVLNGHMSTNVSSFLHVQILVFFNGKFLKVILYPITINSLIGQRVAKKCFKSLVSPYKDEFAKAGAIP